jgi:2-haloacid dehalogenase
MSSKRKKEIGIKTLTETERANSPSASQNYRAMDVLAVVFDAYGTFFDLESFAQQVNKIHRGKGYEILRIVRQKQVEYAMTRTIVKKYENFESITRKAIEFALKELGLATTSADRIFSAFLHLKPYNDVVRSLNDLEEVDVRVAMLSNGTQEMVDKLIEYSGLALLAEESVSVEGAKTFKPDPRAYEHVLNHLEIFERE